MEIVLTSDPMFSAFLVGYFACMMTAFPIAILLLIPHDGWGKHLPSNYTVQLQNEICNLQRKIAQLEGREILLRNGEQV